jgi:hypothetical protein
MQSFCRRVTTMMKPFTDLTTATFRLPSDKHVRELGARVVEHEFNEISAMRSASLTPTQPALGRAWPFLMA